MVQRFNVDDITTKFIKNILNTINVPIVPIWNKGDSVVKGLTYITKEYIVTAINTYDKGDVGGPADELDSKYFKVIEPYVYGKFYKGLTSSYTSNTSFYDSETHYYLGQYLRTLRDLYNIDLMQCYNCWDNVYSDNIRIKKDITNKQEGLVDGGIAYKIITDNTLDDGYKTIIVPIKFNQKYTVYLNSNMPIDIVPVYYDNINIILDEFITTTEFSRTVNRCADNQPYLYDGVNISTSNKLATNPSNLTSLKEDYLALLIQLSESNTSSVVVLEGDYSDVSLINTFNITNRLKKTVFNFENLDDIENIDTIEFEKAFKSYPGIIKTIGPTNYAFSKRLIEYLTDNVITENETFSNNILRIQQYNSSYKSAELNKKRLLRTESVKGAWDRQLRKYNYDLVTEFKTPILYDVNGYVDKDTETIILRGKE